MKWERFFLFIFLIPSFIYGLNEQECSNIYENATAQFSLGLMYELGIGVEKSQEKAIEYYKKAANQDHGCALGRLAIFYSKGIGVVQSVEETVHYSELCVNAEFDEKKALARIHFARGLKSQESLRLIRCIAEAITQYSARAFLSKDIDTNCKIAGLLRNMSNSAILPEIISIYQECAGQGNPDAQFWLGYFYERSIIKENVDNNLKAATFYSSAAEQGYPYALAALGFCHERGLGVKQSQALAEYYYERFLNTSLDFTYDMEDDFVGYGRVKKFLFNKAKAFFDDEEAQLIVGMCYKNGDGVQESPKSAIQYFELAALQGNREAQFQLACLLEFEEFDFFKSAHWYQLAADQGHARAQAYLGYLYEYGIGVPNSIDMALNYYKKAGMQDDIYGLEFLEKIYARGLVESNYPCDAADYYDERIDVIREQIPNLEKDEWRELSILGEKADQGDTKVKIQAALRYHRSFSLDYKSNLEEAKHYLSMAAATENQVALYLYEKLIADSDHKRMSA